MDFRTPQLAVPTRTCSQTCSQTCLVISSEAQAVEAEAQIPAQKLADDAPDDGPDDDVLAENIGFKLWQKFVYWAHCQDLPLLVGAYAIHQKHKSVCFKNGEPFFRKSCVIVFMLGDKERSFEFDRVTKNRLLKNTEKLKTHTEEILNGVEKLPSLPEKVEGLVKLVPENWFVERDTKTKTKEHGEHKVLVMPPAPEEKKRRWDADPRKSVDKRKNRDFELEKSFKKYKSDYEQKQIEITRMLMEAVKNVKNDDFDGNVDTFNTLKKATKKMKSKFFLMKKYEANVGEAAKEDEEMTEVNGYPLDEEEEEEESSQENSAPSIVEQENDDEGDEETSSREYPLRSIRTEEREKTVAATHLVELSNRVPTDPAPQVAALSAP